MNSFFWRFFFLFVWVVAQTQETTHKTIGAWIAAPQHNTIFNSYQSLEQGISKLAQQGINTLFLCVWADHKTAFKSNVLYSNSNYSSLEETSFFYQSNYKSATNDAVQDLINLAHQRQMRVFFWFEYGFMARWGTEPNKDNDPLLSKHPDWKGLGNDGMGTNYNGTDFYYNAYHPGVQQFLLDLIAESIHRYPEVDGIQGDDRLPASPANSGYDEWTVNTYTKLNDGKKPPLDFREPDWFQWRVNILNEFAHKMYDQIKSKGNYTVAFSPNIYPWAFENLMQDWPSWLKQGNVEMLNVQCYRSTFKSYKEIIDQVLEQTSTFLDRKNLSPGVILGVSSRKIATIQSLDSILSYNKELKLGGQTYFYVKWLIEDDTFASLLKKYHLNE